MERIGNLEVRGLELIRKIKQRERKKFSDHFDWNELKLLQFVKRTMLAQRKPPRLVLSGVRDR